MFRAYKIKVELHEDDLNDMVFENNTTSNKNFKLITTEFIGI